MNNYVLSETSSAQKDLSAYVALLNYRFMNLCIKAEVASLMPVTIYIGNDECDIEDVADVTLPNDYQMAVYPKNPNNLSAIIQGIYEAHPEFKMEIKSNEGSEDEASKYVLYTMPEVDENRRDLLMNGVKGLHEECKARINAVYGKYQARFTELSVKVSTQDTDDVNKALDDVYDKCIDMTDELLIQKQQEIEEGYEKYVKDQEQKKEMEFDYSKGIKLFDVE